MRRQWFTFVRLSNSYMPKSRSGFLTITFTTAAFRTEAAYGCLKPAPTSRLRRAYLHLKYSIVLSKQALSWHKLPAPVCGMGRRRGRNGAVDLLTHKSEIWATVAFWRHLPLQGEGGDGDRSEEHTSELQ